MMEKSQPDERGTEGMAGSRREKHDHDVSGFPPLILAEHVGEYFRISLGAARKMIARGDCGPPFPMGRRKCIRREVFLKKIKELEGKSTEMPGRPPRTDREIANMIRGHRRGE